MEFLSFLISSEYLLFSISLIIAFSLALVVFVIGEIDDDYEFSAEDNPILHYMGFGTVPIMVGIMTLLTSFGVLGYMLQLTMSSIFFLLPWWLAAIPTAFVSLIVTKRINALIGKHIPAYENYSVDLSDFINSSATVTLSAESGRIVEGKLVDSYGKTHYVRIKLSKDVSANDVLTLNSYNSESNLFTHI